MATEILVDGTTSWIGGMDTSRGPVDVAVNQYAKGCNVINPDSLGGIRARFGLHCTHLRFESPLAKQAYRSGAILAEGYFRSEDRTYLVCLVDGYVLRFTRITSRSYSVEVVNPQSRNIDRVSTGWIITVPGGCIVNNGADYPIYVTSTSARRTDPGKGEIGIGRMGVYVQHRLFYVDQSSKRILASDYNQPLKFTLEGTGVLGFMCPDEDEKIVAIAKQKSMLSTAEGGNLIWSSDRDIYSADVRGTRSEWANLGSSIGKTTETVPGFSAASSYSFESFNTNIYFRSAQFGMADIKQSEYQFVSLDSLNGQSSEAAYFLDNDTDFMLDRCYTRACNKRLFTTVGPEKNDKGQVYWNGLLSFCPATIYGKDSIGRRFESIFTGVRPWCLTCVKSSGKDELFIHSYDKDGVNRLYVMNEDSDYDIDFLGNVREIEGYIETRAYSMESPMLLKAPHSRFYALGLLSRSTSIILFSRPEVEGPWTEFDDRAHLVCRDVVKDGIFHPVPHKGQTRPCIMLPNEKFNPCYRGTKFRTIQYRLEFKGPLRLESIVTQATGAGGDVSVTPKDSDCITLQYTYRPDYFYSITQTLD